MERLFKRRYSLVCVVIHSGLMNGIRMKSYMNESGWKSGMLLKVTRDIKKYNAGIVPSKPGKKPCVLYITMENGIFLSNSDLMKVSDKIVKERHQ